MDERAYRVTTSLVAAGITRDGWRPARWRASVWSESWTASKLVAEGEGETEREAVAEAFVTVRG